MSWRHMLGGTLTVRKRKRIYQGKLFDAPGGMPELDIDVWLNGSLKFPFVVPSVKVTNPQTGLSQTYNARNGLTSTRLFNGLSIRDRDR